MIGPEITLKLLAEWVELRIEERHNLFHQETVVRETMDMFHETGMLIMPIQRRVQPIPSFENYVAIRTTTIQHVGICGKIVVLHFPDGEELQIPGPMLYKILTDKVISPIENVFDEQKN